MHHRCAPVSLRAVTVMPRHPSINFRHEKFAGAVRQARTAMCAPLSSLTAFKLLAAPFQLGPACCLVGRDESRRSALCMWSLRQ